MPGFTCGGLGETDCVTGRSASPGAATPSPACAVCERAPLTALMLKTLVPVAVEPVVLTVTTEGCGEVFVMLTEAGWKLAVAPVGRPEALRLTVPVKPLSGVTVTS